MHILWNTLWWCYMSAMASQITSLTIVYSIVYSSADERKHQRSVSLAFVWGIHRWPVNSPHKRPVIRKMSPFDDVIMYNTNYGILLYLPSHLLPASISLILPADDVWMAAVMVAYCTTDTKGLCIINKATLVAAGYCMKYEWDNMRNMTIFVVLIQFCFWTSRLAQNESNFADDIFTCIFLLENMSFYSNFSEVRFWVFHKKSALVLLMVWCLLLPETMLTHWGRVTHICVGTNTNIGSDNGLSPGRRQAIIWTNAWILLIGPLGTKFSGILSEIHTLSFKKMHFKTSSAK